MILYLDNVDSARDGLLDNMIAHDRSIVDEESPRSL